MNFEALLLWLSALLAAAAMVFVTGCTACRPQVHVDATGYEIGVSGTWQDVGNAVANVIYPDRPSDGKEVRR